MPVAQYFLFFGKLLCIAIGVAVVILFENYIVAIATVALLSIPFYAFFVVKNKKNNLDETVYINYALTKIADS